MFSIYVTVPLILIVSYILAIGLKMMYGEKEEGLKQYFYISLTCMVFAVLIFMLGLYLLNL